MAIAADIPENSSDGKHNIFISWGVSKLQLVVTSVDIDGKELSAVIGSPIEPFEKFAFLIDGTVCRFGPDIDQLRIETGGIRRLSPSAIEFWRESVRIFEDLISITAPFPQIVSLANAANGILVTGFDVYMTNRIIEMEREGWKSDINLFIRKNLGAEYSKPEYLEKVDIESRKLGCTKLFYVFQDRKITIQNWKKAIKFFRSIYKIELSMIQIDPEHIKNLNTAIGHRHFQTHIDPSAMYVKNPENGKFLEPSGIEFSVKSRNSFDIIIRAVHQMTLNLPHD